MLLSTADLWQNLTEADEPDWIVAGERALRGMYPEAVGKLRDHRPSDFAKYRDAPEGYIAEVLKPRIIQPSQIEIAKSLLRPPYKTIVVSANNVGKSYVAGSLTNWHYDCFDPSATITTAPTKRDVEDVLWKEVRTQRRTRWDFGGSRAPEMRDQDRADHYAKGYTGTKVEAFHGRHDEYMMFILDEAVALKSFVWTGIKSMFKGNGKHRLLALLNPTDTTSAAYAEYCSDKYNTIHLSALDHPNIDAELRGAEEAPIPGAVDSEMLTGWFEDELWFEPIRKDDAIDSDIVWPPLWTDQLPPALAKRALEKFGREGKRFFLRPLPEGQSRVLGIWPTATAGAIWSDLAWKSACRELPNQQKLPVRWMRSPEIGCDVARGTSDQSDKTSIFVQIEGVAVEHRWAGGWDTVRTMTELVAMARKWARIFNEHLDPRITAPLSEKGIPIKVDDGGLGGGVVDMLRAQGYAVVPVNAATISKDCTRYPIMRDQLWFAVPLAARRGEIDLSNLPKKSLQELRRQFMSVQWKPDLQGRRVVEKKADTKKRIQRSPDDADAMNLAFYGAPVGTAAAPHFTYSYQGSVPSSQQVLVAGPFMGGGRR